MSDCVYVAIIIIGFILLLICIAYYYITREIDMVKKNIVSKIDDVISIINVDPISLANEKKNQFVGKFFGDAVRK